VPLTVFVHAKKTTFGAATGTNSMPIRSRSVMLCRFLLSGGGSYKSTVRMSDLSRGRHPLSPSVELAVFGNDLFGGSIAESTDCKVLQRPREPARITGQVSLVRPALPPLSNVGSPTRRSAQLLRLPGLKSAFALALHFLAASESYRASLAPGNGDCPQDCAISHSGTR
jgi:hypothetical protein